MRFIQNLTEIKKEDIALAGGKGANLGELIGMHMQVPNGFIVTTLAYDYFVQKGNLEKIITQNIQSGHGNDVAIRDAFVAHAIPDNLRAEILTAYAQMGGGSVAVRSSATAEDLPGASFAGQQDTYLNMVNEKELLEAVRRTWASLWTYRAISYRNRQHISQEKIKLAVVVQKMAQAEFAGVLFTANPITGNRKEMVVNANPGLGEATVSGLVTPSSFVLSQKWGMWRVISKTKGRREMIITPKEGGGTEPSVAHHKDESLPMTALQSLATLGRKIENHFGSPQDIEWVWAKGKITIVQARPITALPEEIKVGGGISKILAGVLAGMMPTRPFPLESSLFGPETVIVHFLEPFLAIIGLRISPLRKFLIKKDGVFIHYNGKVHFQVTFALLLAPFKLFFFVARYSPKKWKQDIRIKNVLEKIATLREKKYTEMTPLELVATMQHTRALFSSIFKVRILYFPRVMASIASLYVLLLLTRRTSFFGVLVYSGITTKVTQTNDALHELAVAIHNNSVLLNIFQKNKTSDIAEQLKNTKIGYDFLQEFEVFLDTYGYRESGGSIRISQPTWKDSPELVFGILAMLSATELKTKSTEKWEKARDECISHTVLRFPPLRQFFNTLVCNARYFQEIREDTRFYIMMTFPPLRHIALELGNRLVTGNVLRQVSDVFYLQLNEVAMIARGLQENDDTITRFSDVVLRRKKVYADLKQVPVVDPRLYRTKKKVDGALLTGVGGSPGEAHGTARIIQNSSEFISFKSGDILIAPYTNPAWTPLFEKARAIVVDTGGMMSHAAIVAREYGIPAVMGTVDATTIIKNGDVIRVNGTDGTVFLENNP